MSLKLAGSYPALVTPMRAPGDPDLTGIRTLVELLAVDGADGVLVAGALGEGPLLTAAHRRAVVSAACSAGVRVLAAVDGGLADLREEVARMAAMGAEAVLVPVPMAGLRPEEELSFHLAVADTADVPIVVRHDPEAPGNSPPAQALKADSLKAFAEHEGVAGVLVPGIGRMVEPPFTSMTAGHLAVLTSDVATLSQDLTSGGVGAVLAIANLRQRQVHDLFLAVREGRTDRAEALQVGLTTCERRLAGAGWSLPAAIKAALQLEGTIDERWCAPPLDSVPPSGLDRIRTALLA